MNSAGDAVLNAAISSLVAARRRRSEQESISTNSAHYHHHPSNRATAAAASAGPPSIISFLETMVWLTKRMIYILFVSGIILMLSILSYAIIYNLSMPTIEVRRPIYFDYNFVPERHKSGAYGLHVEQVCNGGASSKAENSSNGDESKSQECIQNDKGTHHQSALSTDGPRQRIPAPPTTVVDLQMQHTQWHAYHDNVLPQSSLNLPNHIIKPARRYYVDIALTLPESDLNRRLGMFMLEVDLLASDGTMLASSGRPTMLPHESSIISVARKFVLMGPILAGAVAEARTVVLESFDSFVESPDKPLAAMVVRLVVPRFLARYHHYGESFSSSLNGGNEGRYEYLPIQVHSGEVRIGKELSTVQRIMKEWFYTCGLVAVTLLSVVYAIWFLIIRAWIRRLMKRHKIYACRMQQEQAEYGYGFEDDGQFDSFRDNDSSSDWNATAGAAGRRDDQSSTSGVAFVVLDDDVSEDGNAEEWHDIDSYDRTSRSWQQSASGSGDEVASSIQSIGESTSAPDVKMSPRESADDLESLADELVRELSFEMDSSRSQGGNFRDGRGQETPDNEGVAPFFKSFLGQNFQRNLGQGTTTRSDQARAGEEKKEMDYPLNGGEKRPKHEGARLDKKRDATAAAAAAAAAAASVRTPKNTSHRRADGNSSKKNRSSNKKSATKKMSTRTPRNGNDDPKASAKKSEEKLLADKVMKGDFGNYEIFTDLDEPDPDVYGG